MVTGVVGDFVKRLVGLPGDRISIRNGVVIRNGVPEKDPYAIPCNGASIMRFPGHDHGPQGRLLLHGRQPPGLRGQPLLGPGPESVDNRRGLLHLLAA